MLFYTSSRVPAYVHSYRKTIQLLLRLYLVWGRVFNCCTYLIMFASISVPFLVPQPEILKRCDSTALSAIYNVTYSDSLSQIKSRRASILASILKSLLPVAYLHRDRTKMLAYWVINNNWKLILFYKRLKGLFQVASELFFISFCVNFYKKKVCSICKNCQYFWK